MRFSVLAVARIPDVATARRVLGLDDLSDKSVFKVVTHNRKQQTGTDERLRWDQQMIGGMTLIHCSADGVQIDSMDLSTHSEEAMLQAFYKAALRTGRMVSWDGSAEVLPLLHFRSLIRHVSYPAYWQADREGLNRFDDLAATLMLDRQDRPTLDEVARKMGFPGLLKADPDKLIDAWLKQRHHDLSAFTDMYALNCFLLALSWFSMIGEHSRPDGERAKIKLRDELAKSDRDHRGEFLAIWGGS